MDESEQQPADFYKSASPDVGSQIAAANYPSAAVSVTTQLEITDDRLITNHPGTTSTSTTATSAGNEAIAKDMYPNHPAITTTTAAVSTIRVGTDVSHSIPVDLPELDFEGFISRLRQPAAQLITRYMKSFLREFSKRQWSGQQQSRIVADFFQFIGQRLAENEIWSRCGESELDMTKECMEKLVMSKLYPLTFNPPLSIDARRDQNLQRQMILYNWVREEHLDIPLDIRSQPFLQLAQKELSRMNDFKSPRDKLICILNCCKILIGAIQKLNLQSSADDFLPVLIFTVLHSSADRLYANTQYISRFRNPLKLQSESGYYLTNLMSAIAFIDQLDRSHLTVDAQQYEENMQLSRLEWELYIKKFPLADISAVSSPSPDDISVGAPLIEIASPSVAAESTGLPLIEISAAASSTTNTSATITAPHKLTKTDSMLSDLFGSPQNNATAAKAILQRPLSFINKLFEGSSTSSGTPSGSASTNISPTHSRQLTSNYPAALRPPPVPERPQQQPQFERELNDREKAVLQDYEMQLAMALSLSIAEEEQKRREGLLIDLSTDQP